MYIDRLLTNRAPSTGKGRYNHGYQTASDHDYALPDAQLSKGGGAALDCLKENRQ